jgi:hypothetical protein
LRASKDGQHISILILRGSPKVARTSEYDRKSSQHFQPLSNQLKMILFFVMAGLVPAIHVFIA